ncbi:MAG: T9SS type A sorting domain-containing protein [Ignavibacterium album]|nr:T9SS type A sorting domain-containing protein [Ignavibacterium album]
MSSENGIGRWERIGFVEGSGTTTETKTYSFIDENVIDGIFLYRLKQTNFDGTFEYSNTIEVEISIPTRFSLNQNFPNPFNPVTSIQYAIANKQFVTLKVYDILGKEIATLVNENKEAGNYSVDFNAAELPSGVYIYQLSTADFTQIKKMILTK